MKKNEKLLEFEHGRVVKRQNINRTKSSWEAGKAALELVEMLQAIQDHYLRAHPEMLMAIGQFKDAIKSAPITFSSPNPKGKIFRRRSLLDLFSDIIDPALLKLFPIKSMIWNQLRSNEVHLPIDSKLIEQNLCRTVADRIKNTVACLETCPENTSLAGRKELTRAGETLEALSGILLAINSVLPFQRISWCKACFRRAPLSSKYCDEHRPNQESSLNTQYKKSLKIRKMAMKDLATRWERMRSKRALGEDLILIGSTEDLLDSALSDTKAILVDESLRKICQDTSNGDWSSIADIWNKLLDECPHVRSIFRNSASTYTTWLEFRAALLLALKNKYEESVNPYWIILMLVEAEDWFCAEEKFLDLRLTGTNKYILDMYYRQKVIRAEIARKLGVSRQYVTKIVNENKSYIPQQMDSKDMM